MIVHARAAVLLSVFAFALIHLNTRNVFSEETSNAAKELTWQPLFSESQSQLTIEHKGYAEELVRHNINKIRHTSIAVVDGQVSLLATDADGAIFKTVWGDEKAVRHRFWIGSPEKPENIGSIDGVNLSPSGKWMIATDDGAADFIIDCQNARFRLAPSIRCHIAYPSDETTRKKNSDSSLSNPTPIADSDWDSSNWFAYTYGKLGVLSVQWPLNEEFAYISYPDGRIVRISIMQKCEQMAIERSKWKWHHLTHPTSQQNAVLGNLEVNSVSEGSDSLDLYVALKQKTIVSEVIVPQDRAFCHLENGVLASNDLVDGQPVWSIAGVESATLIENDLLALVRQGKLSEILRIDISNGTILSRWNSPLINGLCIQEGLRVGPHKEPCWLILSFAPPLVVKNFSQLGVYELRLDGSVAQLTNESINHVLADSFSCGFSFQNDHSLNLYTVDRNFLRRYRIPVASQSNGK